MKSQVVNLPSVKDPIKRSPGFEKKQLSTYKLDIMALCGFGCRYCSSNVLALAGKPSNGYPGLPGIGRKGACQLISQLGSPSRHPPSIFYRKMKHEKSLSRWIRDE